MTRLMGIFFLTGVLLCMGAAMMAIDIYMTDDRKTAARASINAQLDEAAASYDERAENGCRRRCGFLATMAKAVTDLRDGIFAGPPFDPETVFAQPPEGWRMAPYDLATVEGIMGHRLNRTPLVSPTYNQLLTRFDDVAKAAQTGAVRLYAKDEARVAIALKITDAGLRGKDAPRTAPPEGVIAPLTATDGLPFRLHPQVSVDLLRDTRIAVGYRHYSMDLDGQVRIDVLATGPTAKVEALLSSFDLEPIIDALPRPPAGYRPDDRVLSVARTPTTGG
ncbi:hypothetical protein FIU94_00910 [Sulfitobacter sp. THAF37]|uniref:hypothetical protein n=1 Tax=Sulfitobacter sp. THAF37 TaxID=2587855 RepID=UPI0012698227|nr:hypothetical protein [Sulfitobacter sp. THAF37]QFT57367.1 hypothetical protein FIU94_00910 [Sulfitobacter sp. THAF37]